jgi:hypothetical protein
MHITGAAGGPPQKVGVAITDVMTGVLSAGAVCVACSSSPSNGLVLKSEAGVLRCSSGAAPGARLAGSTFSRRCWRRKCFLWPTSRPTGCAPGKRRSGWAMSIPALCRIRRLPQLIATWLLVRATTSRCGGARPYHHAHALR